VGRILVIDDSEDCLVLFRLYLAGPEFQVTTCTSGEEGLLRVREQDFDLVLVDVSMPDLDGFAVCARLKREPRTRGIPVILVTGHSCEIQDKLHGYENGADDYLMKPPGRDELLARVRVMLRLKAAQDQQARTNEQLQKTVGERTQALAQALDELKRQRNFAEEIVKSLPVLLLVVDPEGGIHGQNELFARTFDGVPAHLREHRELQRLLALFNGELDPEQTMVLQTAHQGPRTFAVTRAGMETDGRDSERRILFALTDVTDRMVMCARMRDRDTRDLLEEIGRLRAELRGRYTMSNVIGFAAPMRQVSEIVDRVRKSRSTVLIQGESGTGKELVARAIHFDGPFAGRPFIPIHCGAIAPQLIESELFGHERGAFTGAIARKEGLFFAASGGTIFLDEIAETSADLQVKLLRVLQFGEIRPVGSTRPETVDVRIIAATHRNLAQSVRTGTFREDLFYRLNVVTIDLPPLRDRREDIPVLAQAFLKKFNALYGRLEDPVTGISHAALQRLDHHDWPGNVRELENVFDRAFALGVEGTIQEEDLPPVLRQPGPVLIAQPPNGIATARVLPQGDALEAAVQEKEKQVILVTIRECGGDKLEAARRLGIGKSTLYRKIKALGIEG
jgi:DNA-binding NtrC family response regulator